MKGTAVPRTSFENPQVHCCHHVCTATWAGDQTGAWRCGHGDSGSGRATTAPSEHSLSPGDLGSPASPKESSEVLDAAAALSVASVWSGWPTLPKSGSSSERAAENQQEVGQDDWPHL